MGSSMAKQATFIRGSRVRISAIYLAEDIEGWIIRVRKGRSGIWIFHVQGDDGIVYFTFADEMEML